MSLKNPINQEDHKIGPDNAPIILVEYGDYQCPFCRVANGIVKRLIAHYDGQMQFVFRNFPLKEIHPFAEVAAESAEFAAARDHFWEMHDAIYENQDSLNYKTIVAIARKLQLPLTDLENALGEERFKDKVHQDFIDGVKSGVNGTPTFFINEQRYNGVPDFNSLVEAIDSMITQKS